MSTPTIATDELARKAKELVWGGMVQHEVAYRLGVSQALVSQIIRLPKWQHVPWPDGSFGYTRLREHNQQKRIRAAEEWLSAHPKVERCILSMEQATEVKKRLWEGDTGLRTAAAYGVSHSTISFVRNGHIRFDAPWPNGDIGPMPKWRVQEIAQLKAKVGRETLQTASTVAENMDKDRQEREVRARMQQDCPELLEAIDKYAKEHNASYTSRYAVDDGMAAWDAASDAAIPAEPWEGPAENAPRRKRSRKKELPK